VRRGVRRHRRVDAFTDRHPVCVGLRAAFPAARRRYAGIVLDVAFDHFLARHWARFSDQSRDDFVARTYQILTGHAALLPPAFAAVAPRMVAGNWLAAYAHLDGVEAALRGIGRRGSRHSAALDAARGDVETLYPRLEAGFLELFPQLTALGEERP
jgi:acyl carrier protein phosphodiesterase